MNESWICTFPVAAEVWRDAAIDEADLFAMARAELPDGYVAVSEEARYVAETTDEYGVKPEHWVIVVRALPVDATTPPHPVKGEGASVSQGIDDGGARDLLQHLLDSVVAARAARALRQDLDRRQILRAEHGVE